MHFVLIKCPFSKNPVQSCSHRNGSSNRAVCGRVAPAYDVFVFVSAGGWLKDYYLKNNLVCGWLSEVHKKRTSVRACRVRSDLPPFPLLHPSVYLTERRLFLSYVCCQLWLQSHKPLHHPVGLHSLDAYPSSSDLSPAYISQGHCTSTFVLLLRSFGVGPGADVQQRCVDMKELRYLPLSVVDVSGPRWGLVPAASHPMGVDV